MKLSRISGLVAVASLTVTPAFAGSPDSHGPHMVPTPTVHAAPTPHDTSSHGSESNGSESKGSTPHVSHEAEHAHGNAGAFADRIASNTALTARLTPLLPSGMTLSDAAKGFRNEGQFIAALHAAKDLNVSFTTLKAEMTGSEHDSLGAAIHDLKPAADAKTSAKTAASEARADISATRPSIADRIAANTALSAKLTPLLPSGTTLADAAAGFKNQGQFIAALHASKDLSIPFAQLKAEMTGSPHDSLGQAIHDLKPAADAKVAAKTAEQEARTDIKATRPPDADGDADDK
jgi:hypothetical protein